MTNNQINENFSPFNSLELFGLNKYFLDYIKLIENKKIPKVTLFTGDKGIGKFTLSLHLINYFLSINSKNNYDVSNKKINKESSVYKSILYNICDNFIYIGNQPNKKISINDIRQIKKKFSTTSLNNIPKFTVIDDVELLNISAANSLLKLIEEPSENNYFILINNKQNKIIETIKSRSIETKIFVNEKEKKEIFNKLLDLHNIEDHFSHKFLNLSSPGNLIKFSDCLKKMQIDDHATLYDVSNKLLNNYKKSKNENDIYTLNFLLEIKFLNKVRLENKEFNKLLEIKNNIMKLIYDYKNFNLSTNSVLDYIKRHEHYA